MDRIIDLDISRSTATVSQAGFGIIAVFGEFASDKTAKAFTERVRFYGGPDEMKAEGWSDSDPVKKAANVIFMQKPAPSRIAVCRKDAGEEWEAAAGAAKIENDDWYGMVLTSREPDHQKAMAAWAEANSKILGLSSSDAKIKDKSDTTDIASHIQSRNYDRSFVIYHPSAGTAEEEFADAAWLASRFPYTPGKTTWKFCTLPGVTVTALDTAEIAAIKGKNANIYVKVKGLSITEEGVVGSGEYIDVIRGIDWLYARMQENIFQLKKAATDRGEKISFTDHGISQIDSVMKAVLSLGVTNTLLTGDPEPVTSVPRAYEVMDTEKGKRTLPGATFEAHLAGAIHITKIRGVVAL